MLTGGVGVRHPDVVRRARQATEEYMQKLAQGNEALNFFLRPAGRPNAKHLDIPFYFAWSSFGLPPHCGASSDTKAESSSEPKPEGTPPEAEPETPPEAKEEVIGTYVGTK